MIARGHTNSTLKTRLNITIMDINSLLSQPTATSKSTSNLTNSSSKPPNSKSTGHNPPNPPSKRGVSNNKLPSQFSFRTRLSQQLSACHSSVPSRTRFRDIPPQIRLDRDTTHESITRFKRTGCIQCRRDLAEEKKCLQAGLDVIQP